MMSSRTLLSSPSSVEDLLENSSNFACREDTFAKWTAGYASICTSHPKETRKCDEQRKLSHFANARTSHLYLFTERTPCGKQSQCPAQEHEDTPSVRRARWLTGRGPAGKQRTRQRGQHASPFTLYHLFLQSSGYPQDRSVLKSKQKPCKLGQ